MVTNVDVLHRLKCLVGRVFNIEEVIECFNGFEEFGRNDVVITKSDISFYDYLCKINERYATGFYVLIDVCNRIIWVDMMK